MTRQASHSQDIAPATTPTEPSTPATGMAPAQPQQQAVVPFGEAVRTWFLISLQTFGGPAGQIAVMQRALVEEKRCIGQRRFLHALNYCMLLPGPEAQQLAIYTGWLLNGTRGGLAAGTLFVPPLIPDDALHTERRAQRARAAPGHPDPRPRRSPAQRPAGPRVTDDLPVRAVVGHS